MPIVSMRRPRQPPKEAGYYRRPCSGGYLARSFDAQNWAALWKGRPAFVHQVPHEADISALSPVGVDMGLRMRWRATAACQAIYVRILYQATKSAQNASQNLHLDDGVRIDATLYDAGLAVVDGVPACRWDADIGTLPIPVDPRQDGFAIGSVDTGIEIIEAPGLFPTEPRALNAVGVGEQDLILEILTSNVRVVAIYVLELPSEVV